jgi:hypothetical protein
MLRELADAPSQVIASFRLLTALNEAKLVPVRRGRQ